MVSAFLPRFEIRLKLRVGCITKQDGPHLVKKEQTNLYRFNKFMNPEFNPLTVWLAVEPIFKSRTMLKLNLWNENFQEKCRPVLCGKMVFVETRKKLLTKDSSLINNRKTRLVSDSYTDCTLYTIQSCKLDSISCIKATV